MEQWKYFSKVPQNSTEVEYLSNVATHYLFLGLGGTKTV